MFAECDSEWQRRAILSEITERDNTAVEIASGHITTKRGVRIARKSPKGGNCYVNGKMDCPIRLI